MLCVNYAYVPHAIFATRNITCPILHFIKEWFFTKNMNRLEGKWKRKLGNRKLLWPSSLNLNHEEEMKEWITAEVGCLCNL